MSKKEKQREYYEHWTAKMKKQRQERFNKLVKYADSIKDLIRESQQTAPRPKITIPPAESQSQRKRKWILGVD
jgi:hypothetical protein